MQHTQQKHPIMWVICQYIRNWREIMDEDKKRLLLISYHQAASMYSHYNAAEGMMRSIEKHDRAVAFSKYRQALKDLVDNDIEVPSGHYLL